MLQEPIIKLINLVRSIVRGSDSFGIDFNPSTGEEFQIDSLSLVFLNIDTYHICGSEGILAFKKEFDKWDKLKRDEFGFVLEEIILINV